ARSRLSLQQARQIVENLKQPFSQWLRDLLEGTAQAAQLEGVMSAKVARVAQTDADKIIGMHYEHQTFLLGMELILETANSSAVHVLQFMLCADSPKKEQILLRFFPAYRRTTKWADMPPRYGFINSKEWELGKRVSETAKMAAPRCEFQATD